MTRLTMYSFFKKVVARGKNSQNHPLWDNVLLRIFFGQAATQRTYCVLLDTMHSILLHIENKWT